MHRLYTLALVAICAAVGGIVALATNVGFLMAFGTALAVCVVGAAAVVLRENPPKRDSRRRRGGGDRPSR